MYPQCIEVLKSLLKTIDWNNLTTVMNIDKNFKEMQIIMETQAQ